MSNSPDHRRHVVIVGAGFGGMRCLKDLAKDSSRRITLVDRNDYNFFPPLIYQVAGGFLPPSDISYPLRKYVAEKPNVTYRQGTLLRVNPTQKTITLDNGELAYDELILAIGAEVNYFGNKNIEKYSLPMKRLTDALAIRNRLVEQFNAASVLPVGEKRAYVNVVIAGGGPSGVELAGVLSDIRRDVFQEEYPELVNSRGRVILVTADKALLMPFSEKSQTYAQKRLQNYGVKIIFNTAVQDYDGETVSLSNGKTIPAKTLVWTAGVKCQAIPGFTDDDYGHGVRLKVDEHLRIPAYEDIYVVGDHALCTSDPQFPKGHPQLGQVANDQAGYLAKYLKADNRANHPPFIYQSKGNMAMIARGKAIADMPKWHMEGFIAWLAWAVFHIWTLNTAKNRVATTWDWMISFLTGNQSFRMSITPSPHPSQETVSDEQKNTSEAKQSPD